MSVDPALIAIAGAIGAVAAPAAVGQALHRRRLTTLPVRVNVNGHRGKTTVTRLATAALAAGGDVVAGKTTGTVPRLMVAPGWCEWEMRRRPDSPNIGEQLSATRFATTIGARAMVAECMAVEPEYQRVFAEDLTRATIGVICNVLRDHLDVMGPTTADAAEAMSATVPRDGTCVTIPGPHVETMARVARERHSELVLAEPSEADRDCARRFGYLVLPEHVALATAVAQAAGIDAAAAREASLVAEPDPYATRIVDIGHGRTPARFVGGFSVNDPDSTLALWQLLVGLGHRPDDVTVLLASRADRRDRTVQFTELVLPQIPAAEIVVIGDGGDPVMSAHRAGRLPTERVTDLCGESAAEVAEVVHDRATARPGSTIYGIGNVKGVAMELTDLLGAGGEVPPVGVWPDDADSVLRAGRQRRGRRAG
jgi:gamma-polyglutamate synthase